jgi:hypothetical protein
MGQMSKNLNGHSEIVIIKIFFGADEIIAVRSSEAQIAAVPDKSETVSLLSKTFYG